MRASSYNQKFGCMYRHLDTKKLPVSLLPLHSLRVQKINLSLSLARFFQLEKRRWQKSSEQKKERRRSGMCLSRSVSVCEEVCTQESLPGKNASPTFADYSPFHLLLPFYLLLSSLCPRRTLRGLSSKSSESLDSSREHPLSLLKRGFFLLRVTLAVLRRK